MNVVPISSPRDVQFTIQDGTDYYIPFAGQDSFLDRGFAYLRGLTITTPLDKFDSRARDILSTLIEQCRQHPWDIEDPNAMFPIDGIPFRVHFDPDSWKNIESTKGLFVIRRGATTVPSLNEMNLPAWWAEVLTSNHLNTGGLVIISGSTGSGKTTLLYSAMLERLRVYGGHARTIENPVELKLNNWVVGDGLLVQTEPRQDVPYGHAMEHALKQAVRAFPSISTGKILMLGEMRVPEEAAGALAAANSGHLVLISSHGTNVIDTIRRFVSAAASSNGGFGDIRRAREMMAGVLRMVTHQTLRNVRTLDGNVHSRVEGRMLLLREASDVSAPGDAANIIAQPDKDLVSLNQPLTQQSAVLAEHASRLRQGATAQERAVAWRAVAQALEIVSTSGK